MDEDDYNIFSICLNNNFAITPCGYKFCFNCIVQSLQTLYTCSCYRTVLLENNQEKEININLSLKEKIILYLKRLYNEGPNNKEILFIVFNKLKY